MGSSRRVSAAIVALVASLPYLRVPGFEFVFDDHHLVERNAVLRGPWAAFAAFAHHFWHGTAYGAAYYRPVAVASFALNGRLLGWGPAGFHVVNVLLHAANAVLILALLRRRSLPEGAALAAALLFAVHPVAAWPVGSIVARVDLLALLFVLLAWNSFEAARPAWTAVFFLAALLSKEAAAAFLVVPLVGLRTPARENPAGTRPGRFAAAAYCVAAFVLYLGMRVSAGVPLVPGGALIDPLTNPLSRLPALDRIGAALRLAGRYLAYVVFPARFTDPADYFGGVALGLDLRALSAAVVLAALAGVAVVLWVRRHRAAAPLAFALAAFLPVSNIVFPISSLYAQNFLYLPLAGLIVAAADLVFRTSFATGDPVLGAAFAAAEPAPRAPRTVPRRAVFAVTVGGVLLALLATGAYVEAGIWRDDLALMTAWTDRFPDYPIAHSVLGVALLDRGRPADAIPPLRRALALTDTSVEAHYNLGVALLLTSQDTAALEESLAHLDRALALSPRFAEAYANSARVLLRLDRPAEAATRARQALQLDPSLTPAGDLLKQALAAGDRSRSR